MAHTDLSKEMVDLVMKIKKHLRAKHDISIALADPDLLDKLVELKNRDDPVLQGMLSYLMALAGKQWSDRFNAQSAPEPTKSAPSAEKKTLFARYRDRGSTPETPREATTPLKKDEQQEEKKPIRYYRGQPVYE